MTMRITRDMFKKLPELPEGVKKPSDIIKEVILKAGSTGVSSKLLKAKLFNKKMCLEQVAGIYKKHLDNMQLLSWHLAKVIFEVKTKLRPQNAPEHILMFDTFSYIFCETEFLLLETGKRLKSYFPELSNRSGSGSGSELPGATSPHYVEIKTWYHMMGDVRQNIEPPLWISIMVSSRVFNTRIPVIASRFILRFPNNDTYTDNERYCYQHSIVDQIGGKAESADIDQQIEKLRTVVMAYLL